MTRDIIYTTLLVLQTLLLRNTIAQLRVYDPHRNPSFCDRILVSRHQSTIRLQLIAYNSISNGIIQSSDHDLVYQVIQISDTDPFRQFIPKVALMVTWNFGDSSGMLQSYPQLLRAIQHSLWTYHRLSLVHDIDIMFFSFQESVSATFDVLIHEIRTQIRGMHHVQTVQAGHAINIDLPCIHKCIGYKVYGLLFVKLYNAKGKSNIRYNILSKYRTLSLAAQIGVFVSKSAAFTSSIRFEDSFSIIFIASHFPVNTAKTSPDDYFGVSKRIKALRDVYNVVGGGRDIMLFMAGDLNFRQNVTHKYNPDGHFIAKREQLTNVLRAQSMWRELGQPVFSASCKRANRAL